MGQRVATLEIALEMATGNSLAEISRLGGAVNSMAGQAIKDLQRIEQASGGAVNVTGAIGSLRTLQDAVGTTSASAVREFNRIEQAAERLTSQLERDITVYGKTTAQIRDMRVEAAALAAQGQGQIELATRLRGTAAALKELEDANDDAGHAMGLNRNQTIIAQSAVLRFTDAIMAGQSPLRAFALEAHKGVEVLSMDDGGMAGGLAKARALFSPFNIAVAAGTALVVAGAAAWYSYTGSIAQFDALAQGAGRTINTTGAALEASAEAAARNGNITVGAARDIEAAYVQTGKIGMTVLPGLTAVTNDFAVGTSQKLEVARDALAKAFEDPAKGADELTAKYGILDAATLGYVHTLAEQGRETEAQQLLLKGLESSFDGAADHANILARAWHYISSEASLAWADMGKAIDRALTGGDHLERLNSLLQESHRRATGGMPTLGVITGQALGSTLTDAQLSDMIAKERAAVTAEQQRQNLAEVRSRAAGGLKVVDSYTGDDKRGELQSKLTSVNAVLAPGSGASADQLKDAREAQEAYTRAIETYLPPAEKKQKLDELDAQIAAARAPRQKAALAAQREEVSQAGEVITKAQAAADAHAKGAQALATASKATENHAAELAREAAAQESQIRNLGSVAAAYGVSGGAALIAEARTKAESKAIKDRGDVEAAVDREVRLAIAQRVADAAKSTAATNEQADAQEQVNAMVAAGLVPASKAAEMVKDRIADVPLLAAIEAAWLHGSAKDIEDANKALAAQRFARERNNDAIRQGQFLATMQAGDDELERLALETRLIGATTSARVHDLAALKAWQDAQRMNLPIDNAIAYVKQQVAIADQTEKNRLGQDAYNGSLTLTADKWDIIAGKVQSAASGMADAFGAAGKAIGDVTSIYANFNASRARADEEHAKAIIAANGNEKLLAQENAKFALRSSGAQIEAYGDMAAAAKGFFKEGSEGYKALGAAEKVYRIAQLAMSLQAMVQNALETTAHVAGSAAQATADGTAGIAKQSQLPFPANIAAMAATAAALVAAGIAVFGGHGGGTSAADYAKGNTGTGTVLGDSSAQSESIKNAIDALKGIDDATLTVSHDMLTSLRAIESSIGGLASLLVRTGNINADDSVTQGFKTNAIGSILSNIPLIGGFLSSLFGTKTTVIGSGLYGGNQSIGDILANGYDLQTYSDVEKKKKFLGITTSTSYSTNYGQADSSIDDQFTLILRSFYEAIGKAAPELGQATSDVEGRLNDFVFSLGKIDIQGKTGTEIQTLLENALGAAADSMAETAVPGLEKFQKVGEGYFETLTRVASTVEQVDAIFHRLGTTSTTMGIDVDMAVAGMFDSVSDFTSAANAYFEKFYTPAEQAAAKTAELGKVFTSLGDAMPDTIAGFRSLVDAQDLTTDAGRQAYATLLQIAPAFADLKAGLDDTGASAKSAADILSERTDLQRQLLTLQGDTDALRALDRAKIDDSNKALYDQVQALSDAKDAADAAAQAEQALATTRAGLENQILQLTGDTTAIRAAELASLDESLRPLQERIYALTDEKAAAEAATQAAAAAAQAEQALASERQGLMQQLWQLTGDTASIRAAQLASLDESNRALQQQIYDITDAQAAQQAAQQQADAAAQAAQQLADAWKTIGSSIMDEVNRIRGLTSSQSDSYASMLGQFNAATAAARAGDQTAGQSLPQLSKSLLDAAELVATSQQELRRIQGETAASLEQTANLVSGVTGMSAIGTAAATGGSASDATWWNTFATAASSASANDNGSIAALVSEVQGLRAEVAGFRQDNNDGNATIARNTGGADSKLDRVMRSGGGDAFATKAVA